MSIHRILAIIVFGALALTPRASRAQTPRGPLATARTVKCTFPLMAVGTWGAQGPEAKVKPTTSNSAREMTFESINTDEGSAELKATYGGKYDIVVRYSGGYLNFIQSFLDGPLYTTTILEKKTASGKLKAMHSRHEFTDFALEGFTSSPEQYYGECEILN